MQTVGDFLKQEREYRNISLREVSHSTKISGFYLDFLEKGDYGKIPGGPYIKGYISSYADCIGIDAEEALKKYETLNAMQQPSEPILDETPRVIKKRALIASGGPQKKSYFLAVVLLTGCMFGGYHFLSSNKPVTDLSSDSQRSGSPILQATVISKVETDGMRRRADSKTQPTAGSTRSEKKGLPEKLLKAPVAPPSTTLFSTDQGEAKAPLGGETSLPMERTPIVKISSSEPVQPATDGLHHKSEGRGGLARDPQTGKLNNPARAISPPLVEHVSGPMAFSAKKTVAFRENSASVNLTAVDPARDRPEYTPVQPDTSLELVEAAVCTDVKDRTPSGAGESFAWSTARVYTWQSLRCDNPPTSLRHVYYFKGQKVSEIELEIRANLWRTWSYKTLQNEQLVGPWRVDILSADGNLLQRIPFTVN